MNNAANTDRPAAATLTTKEAAALIRKRLRSELGAKRGDVSVRCSHYSGGSSIYVRINNADIRIADVKRIANDAQQIHRCEISGDILGGGNRYVSVEHASDARKALMTPVRDVLAMLAVGGQARSGAWTAQRLTDNDFIAWTGDENPIRCWGLDQASYQFALAMRGDAY